MLCVSGLLLLLLDVSVICGQTTVENRTAFTNESLPFRTDNAEQKQNKSLVTETLNCMFDDIDRNPLSAFPYGPCLEDRLKSCAELICWAIFNESMTEVAKVNWCNVEMVVRSYHDLTYCMETYSWLANCFYPNRVVEQLYVQIHQQYFSSCSSEELSDAPPSVVLVSTLLPILLIPFIVYIVVWKSSLKD